MGKETFYFSHDFNARGDRKMVNLLMTCGIEGVGIYWCIVEMLFEEGGYLMRTECERIAFELRTECERIEKVINSSLFSGDNDRFWSESVLRRLEIRKEKSKTARESANYRWDNAKPMRTHSDSNAIKESKLKENKAISFDEEKKFAVFENGYKQELGKFQKLRAEKNDLKPEDVLKGHIN